MAGYLLPTRVKLVSTWIGADRDVEVPCGCSKQSTGVRGQVSLLKSGHRETVCAFRWVSEQRDWQRSWRSNAPPPLFFLKDEGIEHQREDVPIGQA